LRPFPIASLSTVHGMTVFGTLDLIEKAWSGGSHAGVRPELAQHTAARASYM
jgi:hypothetical protein